MNSYWTSFQHMESMTGSSLCVQFFKKLNEKPASQQQFEALTRFYFSLIILTGIHKLTLLPNIIHIV